jgi:uncharacterized protein YndB with AHSA1/START domain
MNDAALKSDAQDIVVDEVFPLEPETIWKTLTTGELIGRRMMAPTRFEPVEGKHFTFQTTLAGASDGVIHCRVLEVMPNERFVYAWKGGHEGNVGYGSRLDTVITWILSMAWRTVVQRIDTIAAEYDSSKPLHECVSKT